MGYIAGVWIYEMGIEYLSSGLDGNGSLDLVCWVVLMKFEMVAFVIVNEWLQYNRSYRALGEVEGEKNQNTEWKNNITAFLTTEKRGKTRKKYMGER